MTITTLTNLGYAQNGLSKGLSIEGGLGNSGNWSLNYGAQIQLLRWENELDHVFNSYDGFYVLYLLPMPLINLKYQF